MYIYLKDSQLFLMMRIISGDIISRDNTCKTYAALRDCMEEAPRAIEANIAIYEHLAGNPKIDNILTQLYTYQELLDIVIQQLQTVDINSDNYSPTIPRGAHTITLASQTNPDNFLTHQSPTFSLRHSNIGDIQHHSFLGNSLRNAISTIDMSTIHGFTTDLSSFKSAVKDLEILTQLDDEEILHQLETVWKEQQYPAALWATPIAEGYDSLSVKQRLEKRLSAIRALDESDLYIDIGQLIGILPIGIEFSKSPYILERYILDITKNWGHAPNTMVDKVSVLIQFYLAIINVSCKEQDPSTANIGMILEENSALSAELTQAIVTSLQERTPLDQCIIDFLITQGILHDIDHQSVIDLFEKTYIIVRDQEHMDQHTIRSLRSDSPYVHYADAFCVELSSWIKQLSPIYNTDPEFFDKKIDALQAYKLPGNVIQYDGSDVRAPIQALLDHDYPAHTIFELMLEYNVSSVDLFEAIYTKDPRIIDPNRCWVYACEIHSVKLMDFLLSHEIYPDADCTLNALDDEDNAILQPVLSYLIESDLMAASMQLIPHMDLHALDKSVNPPLTCASYKGHEPTMELLIQHGSNIHTRNNRGQTALIIAVGNNQVQAAKYLVQSGASLLDIDNEQQSSLDYAITNQYDTIATWIVKELVAQGHIPIDTIHSLLMEAIEYHLLNVFSTLLTLYEQYHFCPISSSKDPLVIRAAKYGSVAILKHLIEQGHDTTMALHVAVQYGQKQAAKLLIPQVKDINIRYGEKTLPIELAYQRRDIDMCADLLISHRLESYPPSMMTEIIIQALVRGRLDVITFICVYGHQHLDSYLQPYPSALLIATQNNSLEVVRYLCSLPTPQESVSVSPLIVAAHANNIPMLDVCYTYDKALNSTDNQGYTALHHAIKADGAEAVQWLLDRGADHNPTHPRCPSLHLFSAKHHAVNAFHTLLQYHQKHSLPIALDAQDSNGYSMVMYAAQHPASTMMLTLLQNGASTKNALVIAAQSGNYQAARLLLEYGANPNETWNNTTPLAQAMESGHLAIIALLLKDPRIVLDQHDLVLITALCERYIDALEDGHLELVTAILKSQIFSPNESLTDNQSALMIAAKWGQQSLVEFICHTYPETINYTNTDGETPLSIAIRNQVQNSVTTLLWFGAEVDSHDNQYAPLTIATQVDAGDIIAILIRYNATIPRDILHLAAQERCQSALSTWIRCGVAVDQVDIFGNTALFYATKNGDEEAIACLLDHGANPNFINYGYNAVHNEIDVDIDHNITPLMLACIYELSEVVTQLLDAGANPNIVNVEGVTALQYAVRQNHFAIVERLLSDGAKPYLEKDILHHARDNANLLYRLLISGATLPNASQNPSTYEAYRKTLSTASNWTPLHDYIIGYTKHVEEDIERINQADYVEIGILAILYQKSDVIQLIIAQLDSPTEYLHHLLLNAIKHQKHHMISLLISLGADIQRSYTEDMTLAEYAKSQDAEDMLPYLNPLTSKLTQFGITPCPSDSSLGSTSDGHTTAEVDTSSKTSSPATLSDDESCHTP